MKAIVWHGKEDVRCDRVTDPEIEDPRDAIVQQRLDTNPNAMRQRRETVEHPFGTIKARMGATHFLTKTMPKEPPRWPCTCSPTI